MIETAIPQLALNDGIQIPANGFGTYKLNGRESVKAMGIP